MAPLSISQHLQVAAKKRLMIFVEICLTSCQLQWDETIRHMDHQSYVFYRSKCELAIKYEQDIHANSKNCDENDNLDANHLALIACLKS